MGVEDGLGHFRLITKATSELAEVHLSEPQKDIVTAPLAHDTADEITQPEIKDWYLGECEAIPGKTMHKIAVVDRDYTKLYEKFITLGDNIKSTGLGAHGNHYMCEDQYDEMVESNHFPCQEDERRSLSVH